MFNYIYFVYQGHIDLSPDRFSRVCVEKFTSMCPYTKLNVPISRILEPLSRTFENVCVDPFILIVQLNALNVLACTWVNVCEYGYARMWARGERKRIHVFQFYTLHNFRKSSKTSVALDEYL